MYYFKVEYWNQNTEHSVTDSGLIAANSYIDAMEKLIRFYGNITFDSITLENWAEEDILLEEEIMDYFQG